MNNTGWINVESKRCLSCQRDFPRQQEQCPVCGEPLLDATVREPAAWS